MRTLNRLFCSTLFCATVLTAQTVWAITYYVDRNLPGNDGNAGTTEATAFLTIAKCVGVAINPGDTCLVKNGTYPEGFVMRNSGTTGNPIILKNYPGHSPIIRFADPSVTTNRVQLQSKDGYLSPIGWLSIEGFEITNGYDGLKYYNAHNIVIRGNRIHGNAGQGILGNGHHILIHRNIIAKNGNFAKCQVDARHCNQDHGLYLTGTNYTITNNLIYGNLAYGIHIAGYPYNSSNYSGPEFSGARHFVVANNTIAYQSWRAGIAIWQADATDNRIENNILYENSQQNNGNAGIDFVSAGTGHIIRNNLHYATSPGATSFIGGASEGATYTQSSNIVNTNNPNFVNAQSAMPLTPDFSLQSNSPAIDRGLLQSLVTEDFRRIPRPQGAAFDIGAFEYRVETGAAPPSAPVGLRIF